jgi:hypothetical protein
MELMSVLPATVLGYTAFHLTKYPHGKVGKKLPKIKVRGIELSPSIKLNLKDHTIHFHHWMNLAILLAISVPMTGTLWDSAFAKAFMIGGIVQGLTFPDANKVVYRKHQELRKKAIRYIS